MNTNLILDLDDPFVSHSFAPIRAHSCSFVAEIPFLDYYNSASGDLETGQEFAVTVRSEDRRFNDADRTHSQIGGDDDVETVSEIIRREVTRIDVLAQFDPAVLPQFPIHLAAPDINRDDAPRPTLQQTVGKPARRCADVEADSVGGFDLEMIERGG